jgi:acyl carrier protein
MASPQYDDIFREVEVLLQQFAPQQVAIQGDTDLINDLGLDSLKVMEMLNEVEDIFDITYPLNNLSDLKTVNDFTLQIQHIVDNT